MAGTFRDFLRAWEEWRVEVDEYRELDGERVLVFSSSVHAARRADWMLDKCRRRSRACFTSGAGQVARLVQYFDREHALADLGLAPETGPRDS